MHENKAKIAFFPKSAPVAGVPPAESLAFGDPHVSLRPCGPRAEYEASLRSNRNIHRFQLFFLIFIDFFSDIHRFHGFHS